MSEKLYKIGQAAALLNLNTSVLRFWEKDDFAKVVEMAKAAL